jgi:plastocyanin
MRRRIVAAGGAAALLAAIGVGSVSAADRTVTIRGFAFSPHVVTVNVGDSVTWMNRDGTAHTATSGSAWTTGDIGGGRSKSITFRTAGRYDYICAIHPTMTGTVVVQAGRTPATDTASLQATGGTDTSRLLAILAFAGLAGALIGARRFRRATAEG